MESRSEPLSFDKRSEKGMSSLPVRLRPVDSVRDSGVEQVS